MHAIIERTANFVCKQGAQFEIMLKAKQARNSQFDFLRFDHYLNPYYKLVQKAMKEGRYAAPAGDRPEEKKSTCDRVPCGRGRAGEEPALQGFQNGHAAHTVASIRPAAGV